MKRITAAACFLLALQSFAQNEDDALRYGFTQGIYSNRVNAMGGAFASLGGDITNCFQNPAGLAAYKTGVFDITLTVSPRPRPVVVFTATVFPLFPSAVMAAMVNVEEP